MVDAEAELVVSRDSLNTGKDTVLPREICKSVCFEPMFRSIAWAVRLICTDWVNKEVFCASVQLPTTAFTIISNFVSKEAKRGA